MNIFYLKQCFLAFAIAFLCLPFCLNAQTGETCETAIPITSTPYTYSGTTCGAGNNYDDLDITFCETYQLLYTNEEDIIFTFTPEVSGCYNLYLSVNTFPKGSINIFDKCPSDTTAQCLGFTPKRIGLSVQFVENETVFIMIDAFSIYCFDFSLDISLGSPDIINDYCANAIPLQIEGTTYGATGCNEYEAWVPDYQILSTESTICQTDNNNAEWDNIQKGIWYTFQHTGGDFDLKVQNLMCNEEIGGHLKLGIWSNTGTCDLSQEVFYDCALLENDARTIFDIPAGNYYLFVSGNTNEDCVWEFISDEPFTPPVCDICEDENIPPSNNSCANPLALGKLPEPNYAYYYNNDDEIAVGDTLHIATSNICATNSSMLNIVDNCAVNQTEFAADVWYTLTLTAPILRILVLAQGNSLQKPRINLYEYDSHYDTFRALGCEVGENGFAKLKMGGLAKGNTYYLQISGKNATDQCNFDLILNNNEQLYCYVKSNLDLFHVPKPNPVFSCGETLEACYEISKYRGGRLHGLAPIFGEGWDFPNSFVSLGVSSDGCSGNGYWDIYSSVFSYGTGNIYGPGWYYETNNDAMPGNNWGHSSTGYNPFCTWKFCFQITTLPCDEAVEGMDLSIEFEHYSDSQSGVYDSDYCPYYSNTFFPSILVDCTPPLTKINGGGYICESESEINPTTMKVELLSGGAQPTFQWYKNDSLIVNATTDSLIVSATETINNYSIITTNSCGIDTAEIGVLLVPRPELNPTFASSNCDHDDSGYINLGLGINTNYTFNWNDNSIGNTGIPLNLSNDIYEVTVTNEYGCRSKASFDLSYLDLRMQMTANETNCNANSVEIEIGVIKGIPPYSYLWNTGQTTPAIENVSTGTYFITITDAVNCQIVDSIEVVDKTSPQIIDIEQTYNDTTNIVFLYPIIEGDVQYYEWYFQTDWNSTAQLIGTMQSIEATQNGIYKLIASNEYQCLDVFEIAITSMQTCPILNSLSETFDINGIANTVRLAWNDNLQATNYEIASRKVGGNSTWLFWNTTNTYREFSGINNGTYEWSVRAICDTENSDWLTPAQQFTYNSAGKTNVPNPFDTENVAAFSALNIYPNPATSQVTLEYQQNIVDENIVISIFDILGKRVFEQTQITNLGTNRIVIDISHMQKACYFVKIDNGREQMTEKLIIF